MIDPALNDDRTPPSPDDGAARLPMWAAPDDFGRIPVPQASKALLARSLWHLGGLINL